MGTTARNNTLYGLMPTLFGLFVALWFFAAFPLWINQLASSMRGPWVDQAVSQILTDKYGSPVQVQGVYFDRWHRMHFGPIRILSKEGSEMIQASSGSLNLHSLSFLKTRSAETYIRLQNIQFTKEYYKNSTTAGFWGYLMRKPIHVDLLGLRVVENDRSGMQVYVTDCRSKNVKIDGSIEYDRSGTCKNNLQVSVGTWTALRSII